MYHKCVKKQLCKCDSELILVAFLQDIPSLYSNFILIQMSFFIHWLTYNSRSFILKAQRHFYGNHQSSVVVQIKMGLKRTAEMHLKHISGNVFAPWLVLFFCHIHSFAAYCKPISFYFNTFFLVFIKNNKGPF